MNENDVRTDTYTEFKTDLKEYGKPWRFLIDGGYIWFTLDSKNMVIWDTYPDDMDEKNVLTGSELCSYYGIACW